MGRIMVLACQLSNFQLMKKQIFTSWLILLSAFINAFQDCLKKYFVSLYYRVCRKLKPVWTKKYKREIFKEISGPKKQKFVEVCNLHVLENSINNYNTLLCTMCPLCSLLFFFGLLNMNQISLIPSQKTY